jgi:uncharacterized membrane protein
MNDTLMSSKILAAIGSIMLGLSFIPILGSMMISAVLGVIGIICIFSGIKGLSEYYRDSNIYRNAFTGAIFGAIGLIVMGINEFVSYSTGIFITDLMNRVLNPSVGMFDIQYFVFNTTYFLPFLTIIFIFNLLMALYFGNAFQGLAKRSGEKLFNAAKTMMLIGAILTLVFFVGLILIGIAFILATAAFCLVKTGLTTPPESHTPQITIQPETTEPSIGMEAKYCPHCGAPVAPKTAFCTQCGKQI